MSSYSRPRNYLTIFNPEEYNNTSDYITLSKANTLFFNKNLVLEGLDTSNAPTYTFTGSTGYGMGLNGINTRLYANGIVAMSLQETLITSNVQHRFSNGTATDPSITFVSDSNCGIYRIGADNIGISVNAVKQLDISGSLATFTSPVVAPSLRVGADDYRIQQSSTNLHISQNGVDGLRIDNGGNCTPTGNHTQRLGNTGFRWAEVYATSGTINTSDERQKENILPVLGLEFINDLKPVQYKWKDGIRQHYGLLAQDVKKTVDKYGDFGGYIREIHSETGEISYGLRYSEFIAPMIRSIQQLDARLSELEKK